MTVTEFAEYLRAQRVQFTQDGNTFSAGENIDLHNLTTLPVGISLSAGGYLDLSHLATLPDGVSLSAGGDLYLRSLTTLPEGVSLSAGGYLYLHSLTTLPDGVSLSAGENLYLHNLTTLPVGISLSAGGYLDLRSLTSETQSYQGQTIRLRTVDYQTMRLIGSRDIGGVTVWTAQYFKGHLDTDPRCYVAQDGDEYAHGDTIETALRDLRFKVAQRDLDPRELVNEIKAKGVVSFNDYRLLTGACAEGLRQGLIDRGLSPNIEQLPLSQALDLCKGGYGGDTFRRLMGVA